MECLGCSLSNGNQVLAVLNELRTLHHSQQFLDDVLDGVNKVLRKRAVGGGIEDIDPELRINGLLPDHLGNEFGLEKVLVQRAPGFLLHSTRQTVTQRGLCFCRNALTGKRHQLRIDLGVLGLQNVGEFVPQRV